MADSIDIQNILSKTQIVEKMVDVQRQQPDANQKQFAELLQKNAEANRKKAVATSKSKESQIDKDKKRRQEKDKLLLSEEHQHKDESQDSEDEEQNNTALSPQSAESDKGQTIDTKA